MARVIQGPQGKRGPPGVQGAAGVVRAPSELVVGYTIKPYVSVNLGEVILTSANGPAYALSSNGAVPVRLSSTSAASLVACDVHLIALDVTLRGATGPLHAALWCMRKGATSWYKTPLEIRDMRDDAHYQATQPYALRAGDRFVLAVQAGGDTDVTFDVLSAGVLV